MCRSVQLGEKCFRHRCFYAHHESELVPATAQVVAPAQKTAASSANISKESPPAVSQQKVADPILNDIFKQGSAAASDAAIVSRSMQDVDEAVVGEWVKVSSPKSNSMAPSQASFPASSANYYEPLDDATSVLPKIPIPSGTLSDVQVVKGGADAHLFPGVPGDTPIEKIDLTAQ